MKKMAMVIVLALLSLVPISSVYAADETVVMPDYKNDYVIVQQGRLTPPVTIGEALLYVDNANEAEVKNAVLVWKVFGQEVVRVLLKQDVGPVMGEVWYQDKWQEVDLPAGASFRLKPGFNGLVLGVKLKTGEAVELELENKN